MEYFGWNGKVLNVDLTNRVVNTEPLDLDMAKKYVGGLGFGLKVVYDEVKPGMDAFDPATPIVFTTGPVTATDVPSSGAYVVVTKSPLTNTLSQAEANGFFGYRLKLAGYDYVVIRGKAEKPVYLWINNDQVEIRDASHVWGLGTHETEEILKAEAGGKNVSVASIGPAGENLVRYACIQNDFGHSASSGGPGAVMGSKNLKAIVASGNQHPRISDPERAKKLIAEWVDAVNKNEGAQGTKAYGTAGGLSFYNQIGDLTTNNLTTNLCDYAGDIDGVAIRTRRETTVKPCYKCPINHVHWINLPCEKHGMTKFEEPEFEGMAGFGSNLGVKDMDEIFYLNHLADDYGMCLKTLAFVISLAMECYEKGLLTQEQLGGLDLKFGNSEAAAQLIQMIGRHEGIGVLFGENLRTIAETIGGEAVNMVVEINGGGIQVHDFRSLWGFLLSSAVSDFSATYISSNINVFPLPEIGYDTPLDPGKRDDQAIATAKTIPQQLLMDVLIICGFPGPTVGIPAKLMVETLSAVTGVE